MELPISASSKKYNIGITFGAFDPLHYGHIKLFERAKKTCNILIVCISNNDYIKKHKGHSERFSLKERIEILKAIKYIDKIDKQNIKNRKEILVKKYKADVIYVGDDWTPATFTGEGLGIPVKYLPYTPNINSTNLWKK